MFTFSIENHEPFGPLTKTCPKLDKNETIESRFLVFAVYKSLGGGGVSKSMDGWGCAILALQLVPKNLIFA